MTFSTSRLLALAAVAAGALTTQAHAVPVFSLADTGTSLIRFDTTTPGLVTTVGAISGATTRLDGLDFRPSDGMLYGYSDTTDSVYTVNTATGVVTLAAALDNGTSTVALGVDFNPVADRLRIVTLEDRNLRANVATGATVVDGTLAYAAGDRNVGVDPGIIDAAYTNSSRGAAPASTQLYYLDIDLDTLVTTSAPNAGVLTTVGALGVDIDGFTGFDIYSAGGTDTAFAQFRVGAVNGLYTVDLATGAATFRGVIGDDSNLFGLAVVPGAAAAVPEPGSLALLGAGGLAAFAVRRRRPARGPQAA